MLLFFLQKLRLLPQRAQQDPWWTGSVLLSFDFDSDYHSTGSIVTVVSTAAPAISAAAHDVWLPEVASTVSASAAAPLVMSTIGSSAAVMISSSRIILVVSASVAALVVVVVMPLLFALHAHIGHYHLGTVPHGHAVSWVVPAGSPGRR